MSASKMGRIVYITAGGAGMYCGSCMRDNAVVLGMRDRGEDALLVPLYTPIRTDAEDGSIDEIFFGGINVWLQQKAPFLRWVPAALDHWLDSPKLLAKVATGKVEVDARKLGAMTLSMARGEHGRQRKEVRRLVRWLQREGRPDVLVLTNLLVGGSIPAIRRAFPQVPIVVTLQGDDVFLDALTEPWREKVLTELRKLAQQVDGFVAFNTPYQKRMGEMLAIPESKFYRTQLGVEEAHFSGVAEQRREDGRRPADPVLGYFARICPEKGFDLLVDAFVVLAQRPGMERLRLRVGGWLTPTDEAFFAEQLKRLEAAGLGERFDHVGSPDMASKRDFFAGIDVFCVPARFVEPKGIYAMEALACGVPIVGPDDGAFPELIEASGGGRLFPTGNMEVLVETLAELISDREEATRLGETGLAWIGREAGHTAMVESTLTVLKELTR